MVCSGPENRLVQPETRRRPHAEDDDGQRHPQLDRVRLEPEQRQRDQHRRQPRHQRQQRQARLVGQPPARPNDHSWPRMP